MVDRQKISVDHIYAIRRVQYTRALRERFKVMPDGVNSLLNLTHCCKTCNLRKGAKAGIYIFLARFGGYFMPVVWVAKWAVFIGVLLLLISNANVIYRTASQWFGALTRL